jgi:hypothetical protein
VGGQLHVPTAFHREGTPQYPLNTRLGWPRSRYRRFGGEGPCLCAVARFRRISGTALCAIVCSDPSTALRSTIMFYDPSVGVLCVPWWARTKPCVGLHSHRRKWRANERESGGRCSCHGRVDQSCCSSSFWRVPNYRPKVFCTRLVLTLYVSRHALQNTDFLPNNICLVFSHNFSVMAVTFHNLVGLNVSVKAPSPWHKQETWKAEYSYWRLARNRHTATMRTWDRANFMCD